MTNTEIAIPTTITIAIPIALKNEKSCITVIESKSQIINIAVNIDESRLIFELFDGTTKYDRTTYNRLKKICGIKQ